MPFPDRYLASFLFLHHVSDQLDVKNYETPRVHRLEPRYHLREHAPGYV